jgi:hypothetical protein
MNAQKIFNTVATHLFRQGHRAMLDDGVSCAYRAPNGDMCAVGVLIPDELYDRSWERTTIFAIKSFLPQWATDNELLLADLQRCHDNGNWIEENMKKELIGIAKSYGLEYGILSDLHFGKVEDGEEETGDV